MVYQLPEKINSFVLTIAVGFNNMAFVLVLEIVPDLAPPVMVLKLGETTRKRR